MVYHRLLCSLECSNALLCIQVYVNALALLMRIYVRDHMHHIAERLMSLANVFKNEEKAYTMEGRSDAPLAGERAKVLEAAYLE
ncbi:hypothetical protein BHE74_00019935 [Ensete ventricosum]|nr:hypothetical protein GW17_00040963 [Ensete ventricosum]RWW72263.1 hypothetical protein BHE74_00019935 [Ensete ventricosum]RZR92805.1 hypothetical protein BHM03_00021161 [Ensete ventricosum]